jgi:hypothetical protein
MLIQIESGDKNAKRKVRVEPDDGEPFEFQAANLVEAHKSLAAGRKDGWDSLRPKKAK